MRTDRALTARRAISAALLAMLMLALAPSVATAADYAKTSVGLTPLTDLGTGSYMGVRGGLYPDGTNEPSPDYAAAGDGAARAVVARDAQGHPGSDGKIVLLS